MKSDMLWLPWQPMASAPKSHDGLLLCWADDTIEVGWWDDDRSAKHPKPFWTCHKALALHEKTWFRRNTPIAWCELTFPHMNRLPENMLGEGYELVRENVESGDEKLTLDISWHPCLFVGEPAENIGIVRRKSVS